MPQVIKQSLFFFCLRTTKINSIGAPFFLLSLRLSLGRAGEGRPIKPRSISKKRHPPGLGRGWMRRRSSSGKRGPLLRRKRRTFWQWHEEEEEEEEERRCRIAREKESWTHPPRGGTRPEGGGARLSKNRKGMRAEEEEEEEDRGGGGIFYSSRRRDGGDGYPLRRFGVFFSRKVAEWSWAEVVDTIRTGGRGGRRGMMKSGIQAE